jgi:hypothetical protein
MVTALPNIFFSILLEGFNWIGITGASGHDPSPSILSEGHSRLSRRSTNELSAPTLGALVPFVGPIPTPRGESSLSESLGQPTSSPIRRASSTGGKAAPRLRPERMVPRPSQHRLSHRIRHELLQRALQPRSRTGGSPLDADDLRDLPQEPACGVTPACTRSWSRRHDCRAPSAFPPGASGMDTVADGALGSDHRSTYCSAVRTHSRR